MKITSADMVSVKETKLKKSKEVDKQRAAEAAESSGASASEETVDISSAAREIQTASRVVSEAPDIREDKVVEIRNKIERNEYHVSSGDIADKMLKDIVGG